MAATVTILKRTKFLGAWATLAEVTLDNAYPTGGEAITAKQLGLQAIDLVVPSPAGGYVAEWDYTNDKLKVLQPFRQHAHDLLLTGGQAAGDALQVNTAVVGKTGAGNVTAAGGASNIQNATANVASEVANGTDLSTLKVRLLAVGL